MLDSCIVPSFAVLLQQFVGCFTAPSFVSFSWLASGWVLNLRRHTVTETVRAAQAVGAKHISSFHRFFSRGRWITDEVGMVMVRLVVSLLDPKRPIVVPIDDTLGRHTGKRIAAASMHRDPLLSTGKRPFFHWGHVWVVLSINVYCFEKTWALPVLFRLYRSKKRCVQDGRVHRKTTELARELVRLLAAALPDRKLIVVGDAAYTNATLIKGRPRNVTLIGRSRLDAALYAPPPQPRRRRGRPRVRGARVRSPGQRAARKDARWQRVRITVYGKTVTVRILIIDALWYVAAGGELVRLVLVRGFPGHDHDDVFVSTDPTLSPQTIIQTFGQRWALEVSFFHSKGRLGFEDPQNRTEHAVERTAPMALWSYSLVVIWYVTCGQHLRAARLPVLPWYESKALPSFGDMLATLRRASWLERISLPCADVPTLRKRLRPILEYAAA
ncbi:MAG: transposase [Deltaproteobacteria bacterium]|nr:transposase [Deltaproteobacteria bacterium]